MASCKNLKVDRKIQDENVTVFFKNLQNVTLASISYHIMNSN